MRWPDVLCATVTAATLFAAPGCTKLVTGNPILDASSPASNRTDCEAVPAPLTTIESHGAGEPRLKIPQPSGWQRSTMVDSEPIRFTMSNKALMARSFMPTTVVTLESIPGGHADYQTVFGQERTGLLERLDATGIRASQMTLCGDKAELVDYDAPSMDQVPPRTARLLMVIATFSATTYVATVTVQSTDPTNPSYVRDVDTILTGFRMLPPEGG